MNIAVILLIQLRKKDGPIILKNRRLRIVSKEEHELANKKRLEHKAKLDSRKNKLNFIYDSNGKKLVYKESKVILFIKQKGFRCAKKH